MQSLLRHSQGRQGCFCSPGAPRSRQWQPARLLVRAAGGNGAEKSSDKKLDVEKQREIAKMLLTTQKNMLALNNSRVKVQEELAVANKRIADLERDVERLRLETIAAQQAAAEAKRAPPQMFSAPRGASPAPPGQYMQQQMPQQQVQQPQQMPYQQQQQMPGQQQQPQQQQQQMQQQQQPQQQQMQQQPPQQMAPPPPPAPPAVINLTYISGWHNCFIHFTVDGKSWTAVPGTKLTTSQQDHSTKTISIEGTKMEFVMNNGDNDWDSPGRFTDKPKNYEISAPGNYRLKSGKLERVQ